MSRPVTHGLTGRRILSTWNGMMSRCYKSDTDGYHLYGGRGISVYDAWHDPKAFAEWAYANGYRDNLTIDRIDNNGNYAPGNVRFITSRDQARNRRSNHLVTAFGETKLLIEWAEDPRCKVDYKTLHKRIAYRGWDAVIAITTPYLGMGKRHATYPTKLITAFGETKLITDWLLDSRCVATYQMIIDRLSRGWHSEDALTMPKTGTGRKSGRDTNAR